MIANDLNSEWTPKRQIKKRRPHSQEAHYKQGASRLGISLEEYTANREQGLRWCSGHQRWQPAAEFMQHKNRREGVGGQCIEANRQSAREYSRRKQDAKYRKEQAA